MGAQRTRRSTRVGQVMMLAAVIGATATTAIARADTTFGGDPTQAITTGLSCSGGAPPYFHGSTSCMWNWSFPGGGIGDGLPFPETTGGSGTVTSVTLPAMPNPGPMQAVVLTGTEQASNTPSEPNYYCCQIAAISPTFTVPPNQVTTVALNLPVSSAPTPNFADPGEQGSFDGMAISVLDPNASLPLLEDQSHAIIGNGNGWLNKAYFPAPAQTDMEYVTPTDPSGYEMLAQFHLSTGTAARRSRADADADADAARPRTSERRTASRHRPGDHHQPGWPADAWTGPEPADRGDHPDAHRTARRRSGR